MSAISGVFTRPGHGVDAHAAIGVVEGSALGQADLSMFGGDVAGVAGHARQTGTGGDVDDGPEALFGHQHQLVLHREEHAAHVGREHQGEGLDRVVDARVGVGASVDAGAVDRNIETSEFTSSDLDRVADGVLVTDVGDDGPGLRRPRSRA
jgi:hypothetical protein